jgi:hypothetical protein
MQGKGNACAHVLLGLPLAVSLCRDNTAENMFGYTGRGNAFAHVLLVLCLGAETGRERGQVTRMRGLVLAPGSTVGITGSAVVSGGVGGGTLTCRVFVECMAVLDPLETDTCCVGTQQTAMCEDTGVFVGCITDSCKVVSGGYARIQGLGMTP